MTDVMQNMKLALHHMREQTAPQLPVQVVEAFLLVAKNEGRSLQDLAELADAQMSTMSRQLLDLGERNRKMEEGFKLVKSEQNPMNLRSNMYSLTPKGRLLLRDLETILTMGKL